MFYYFLNYLYIVENVLTPSTHSTPVEENITPPHQTPPTTDAQARSLAILYSNQIGKKTYSELAPLLGLPKSCQASESRSSLSGKKTLPPGINDWAIEMAASWSKCPIQNGMDGTRVIRSTELYLDTYLAGKEFPPDVRCFPSESDLPLADCLQNIKDYMLHVRQYSLYVAEAYI